jgi:iron complex outermembrane recepter protein
MSGVIRRIGCAALLPACASWAWLVAFPATAQNEVESGVLEEVFVTAQKRSEDLQEVPIALTALTAAQLESRGIANVYDLASLAPNLQISRATANTTGAQIAIRGSVQINPALTWEPTVGMYLDGVYIGKTQGSVFDVVDLERIEVMRGPQGTLYGRNTLAGAINFITPRPSGELSGKAQLQVGNYAARIVKASLDLPSFGIASVALGGRVERRDGTVETTPGSSADELNTRDNEAARLAVLLGFSDAFEADYRFDYSHADQMPLHSQLYRALIPALAPYVSRQREDTASIDGPSFERTRILGHSLTLNWELDANNTLKSISARRDMQWDDGLDLDGSPLPVAYTSRLSDYEQTSQELQLVGAQGRWKYVGGLYYFEDDGFTNNPQTFFFGTFNFDSQYGFTTKAWSAFGQVDFSATDALTLTAGVRYNREKKTIERSLGVNFAPGTPFLTLVPDATTADETFSSTTPLLIAAYRFSDALNVYAKYAEGFKSGGFNGEYGVPDPTPTGVAANVRETQTPFKPEKQQSIELGAKSTFLEGRAQLNVAVFENRTEDLQLSIFTGQGAAASVVRNAGKSNVRGLEVEGVYLPVQGVRLQFGYGYLDPEYDEFFDAGVDVASNRAFVHAPEHSFSATLDVRLARMSWGSLGALLDYAYTDSFYTYPYQLASSGPQYNPAAQIAGDTRVDGMGILNARLALSELRWGGFTAEVALVGRNLTDVDEAANYIDFGPSFGSLTDAYFIDPRMYWIECSARW